MERCNEKLLKKVFVISTISTLLILSVIYEFVNTKRDKYLILSIIGFILFNLIFSKVKIILNSKNYLQLGCLIFLSTSFIPLLPSGAFFADYNLTILWINLSIMYAVEKKNKCI